MAAIDTLAALCRALDAGDDSALLAIADWLEEAGDARAAGLRLAFGHRPADTSPGGGAFRSWRWVTAEMRSRMHTHDHSASDPALQPDHVFSKLPDDRPSAFTGAPRPRGEYHSRSAAFLALAQALAEALPQ